jgi:hypothetical protein
MCLYNERGSLHKAFWLKVVKYRARIVMCANYEMKLRQFVATCRIQLRQILETGAVVLPGPDHYFDVKTPQN